MSTTSKRHRKLPSYVLRTHEDYFISLYCQKALQKEMTFFVVFNEDTSGKYLTVWSLNTTLPYNGNSYSRDRVISIRGSVSPSLIINHRNRLSPPDNSIERKTSLSPTLHVGFIDRRTGSRQTLRPFFLEHRESIYSSLHCKIARSSHSSRYSGFLISSSCSDFSRTVDRLTSNAQLNKGSIWTQLQGGKSTTGENKRLLEFQRNLM